MLQFFEMLIQLSMPMVEILDYALSVIDKQTSTGSSLITLNHLLYGGATASGIVHLVTSEIERILSLGYTPVTMEECIVELDPMNKFTK